MTINYIKVITYIYKKLKEWTPLRKTWALKMVHRVYIRKNLKIEAIKEDPQEITAKAPGL